MRSLDEEYSRLMSLKEDDLYYEIGGHLYGKSMMPTPKRALIERVRDWCNRTLAPAICGDRRIRALAKQDLPTHEQVVAITGILDVATHVLGGVPTITVAVLIVRIGLHRFCSVCWSMTTDSE